MPEKKSKDRIGFRINPSFYDKLEKYRKSEGLTITQFIISAINEKIERIENPIQNNTSVKINGVQKELEQQTKIIMNGLKELKFLQKTSNFIEKNGNRSKPKPDIEKLIMNCFDSKLIDRTTEPLTIEQLAKRTELDPEIIYKFVLNSKEIIPKGRGFIKL